MSQAKRCKCGRELPWHLAEVAALVVTPKGATFEHACLCGRNYRLDGVDFVRAGWRVNPCPAYDFGEGS